MGHGNLRQLEEEAHPYPQLRGGRCAAAVGSRSRFSANGACRNERHAQLRQLEEEDPQLRVVWNERLGEIHLQLMGEVQLEILTSVIAERFGVDVTFDEGSIVYRETITEPVIGIGHFEPLRHYAEVHLLLEPAERGSGIQLSTACPTDVLDLNWQRLILTFGSTWVC